MLVSRSVRLLLVSTSLLAVTLPRCARAESRRQSTSRAVTPEETYPIRFATPADGPSSSPRDGDLVLGVVVGDAARAYPLSTLWEEGKHTVNDELGGAPIAVSMCPLAGVGATYLRRSGKDVLDIGSLVAVDRGSLVLYDRQTHTTWNLLTGAALGGPLGGGRLSPVPTVFTTWARWRAMHPTTSVHAAADASAGFEIDDRRMRSILRASSGPLHDRDWVLGLAGSRSKAAVLVRQILDRRVANTVIDGRPLVVYLALDLTTTAAWERSAGGRTLTFRADGDRMTDAETSSVWDPTRDWRWEARSRSFASSPSPSPPASGTPGKRTTPRPRSWTSRSTETARGPSRVLRASSGRGGSAHTLLTPFAVAK